MKLTYGLIAAGLALAMMATPATALDASVTSQVAHFAECLNLMFTNPAAHATQCGPGHDVFVSGSTGFASPPPKIVPPPIVTVDLGL